MPGTFRFNSSNQLRITSSRVGRGKILDRARAEEVMVYAIGLEAEFFDGVMEEILGEQGMGADEAHAGEVRKLSTLLEASQALSATLDLQAALTRVLEILVRLDGVVDVYMPDFKIWTEARSRTWLKAADYPEAARAAIREMHPYELPAIHAFAFAHVDDAYAAWIAENAAGG